MDIKASAKFVRISPKKAQALVRALRGKKVTEAVSGLKHHPTKASLIVSKLIRSALSNAKNNYNLKEDNLKIKLLTVDSGPRFKRYWFRSHGSADQLLKRASHFNVVLTEINPTLVKKTVAKQDVEAKSKTPAKETTTPKGPVGAGHSDAAKLARQTVGKVRTQRTTNK